MARTLSALPLLLKEPLPPLHAWVMAGWPADRYPGDDAFPEARDAHAEWERAMEEERG
jgi:hypothetical protein